MEPTVSVLEYDYDYDYDYEYEYEYRLPPEYGLSCDPLPSFKGLPQATCYAGGS